MPRPKQRTPELRERVLATALEVLSEEGVRGLTTREVAQRAGTSPPAIYELFGDKGGLVREIFLEGFRRLRRVFAALPTGGPPLEDARAMLEAFRRFAADNPVLVEVMFARPFADFSPDAADLAAGIAIHDAIIARIERCIEAGLVEGDATDVAHAVMALAQGLAAAERAGRLGAREVDVARRWRLATDALLKGLHPAA